MCLLLHGWQIIRGMLTWRMSWFSFPAESTHFTVCGDNPPPASLSLFSLFSPSPSSPFLVLYIPPAPLPPFPTSPLCPPAETSHNANATPNANRQVTSDPSPTNSSRKRSNLSEKGPRVRTVLSEQQLQTLRTVYASNPRPDALLKEHLVEMTGLSPRVIRVWFQNKRCKDKKKTIQAEAVARQQQQQGQGGQPLQQSKV